MVFSKAADILRVRLTTYVHTVPALLARVKLQPFVSAIHTLGFALTLEVMTGNKVD